MAPRVRPSTTAYDRTNLNLFTEKVLPALA
jgi:hypothetical protein